MLWGLLVVWYSYVAFHKTIFRVNGLFTNILSMLSLAELGIEQLLYMHL